jgi:hypothetical protein
MVYAWPASTRSAARTATDRIGLGIHPEAGAGGGAARAGLGVEPADEPSAPRRSRSAVEDRQLGAVVAETTSAAPMSARIVDRVGRRGPGAVHDANSRPRIAFVATAAAAQVEQRSFAWKYASTTRGRRGARG